jgi:hypothetical protein
VCRGRINRYNATVVSILLRYVYLRSLHLYTLSLIIRHRKSPSRRNYWYALRMQVKFMIETDASDFALGYSLLPQGDDRHMHPIAFEGKEAIIPDALRGRPAFQLNFIAELREYLNSIYDHEEFISHLKDFHIHHRLPRHLEMCQKLVFLRYPGDERSLRRNWNRRQLSLFDRLWLWIQQIQYRFIELKQLTKII